VSNNEAYKEFIESFQIMTEVLDSDNKKLIGSQRTILNQKHLGTIGYLLNPEKNMGAPQLNSLLKPDGILEKDLFWDNFWLFKKREEEKRVIQDGLDSDEETEHVKPMKIGEIMRNPNLLVLKMFSKRFRKVKKHLLFINSIGGLTLMSLLFAVQLRYSRRFRKYTKTVIHLMLFLITILGFSGSFFLFYKSLSTKRKPQIKDQKDEYEIENQELPDPSSEIEFKKE